MGVYDERFRCTECGFEGHSDDWESKCVYYGSREEPPEWEAWCPDCGASWEFSEDINEEKDID